MGKSPLVSMIIPVFNAEMYLPRLFKSLKRQTYKNLEIIIVNDGSGDKTKDKCEEFAAKCKNVRVITIDNSGVSVARNTGIAEAHGKYIVFCDADDWYKRNGVKILVDQIEKCEADFCFGGIIQLGITSHKQICATKTINNSDTEENKLAMIRMLERGLAPNGKIYKRDVIEKNGMQFAVGMKFSEDALFIWQYLLYCKKICCTGKAVFYYSQLASNNACRKYFRSMNIWLYNATLFFTRYVRTIGLDPKIERGMRCKAMTHRFAQACMHYAIGLTTETCENRIMEFRETITIFSSYLRESKKYFDEYGTEGMKSYEIEMMRFALNKEYEALVKSAIRANAVKSSEYKNGHLWDYRERILPKVQKAVYKYKIGYND